MVKPRYVILPSETQSREFDAKLLLACALAEKNVPTFVGSRIAIHNSIHKFPTAVYVAKDFRKPSNRIFRILKGFGHSIMAWDEEAVVLFNIDSYHQRRVHADTLAMVDELFAWGSRSADILRTAPGYHPETPIHVLGNPRIDMLRPELRSYYKPEVEALRKQYGQILLINSNFGRLNHAVSKYVATPPVDGAALSTSFIDRAMSHRMKIFESFKQLLPFLAKSFPDHSIILRPHPSENHNTWKQLVAGLGNVHVVHEGPVQNWILAADAMIHNGCTTGIEGYLLDAPVVSYMPVYDPAYDFALTAELGYRATSLEEVVATIRSIRTTGPMTNSAREKSRHLGSYYSSLDGQLASDRMASEIHRFASQSTTVRNPGSWLNAQLEARVRAATKWFASHFKDHKNSKEYAKQRFPGESVEGVQAKILRLQGALNRFEGVTVQSFAEDIFLVRKA